MPALTPTNLELRRSRYIAARLGGKSVREAAADLGISEQAAYKSYEHSAEVQDALRKAAAEYVANASRRAGSLAEEAVATMATLMREASTDAVRLGAARAVVDFATGTQAAAEADATLKRLEQEIAQLEDTAAVAPAIPARSH